MKGPQFDYFQEKISEIEDPEELLETKKKEEEHERKTTEQLINQLDDESKERIKLAQDYGYLLNWSVETIYKACFIFNQILKRAEVDLGIKLKDMKYLTSQEIIALKKIDKQHLELKKKGYGYVRTGVKPILLLGKEFKQFQKWSETLTAVDKEISEIKGKGVFEGVVKGQAVIINEDADLKKVQKGDIIVCSMTSPNFVIAMEKAVGWVTDEGGLVCHASVLAREMKKPCIVGTRIATKVIKEGDTIQIDSKKGTVKKI